MGRVEELIEVYGRRVALPWEEMLSDQEKVWFCVYEPVYERRIQARLEEFKIKTVTAGHRWVHYDICGDFESWLIENEYHEEYFKKPSDLEYDLPDFCSYMVDTLSTKLGDGDSNTVSAITGIGTLFGIVRASTIIDNLIRQTRVSGRLLFFFPGDRDGRNYRLLKARDGWNYLATPIEVEE
ncbi:hypothetical protein J2T58_001295 [Methanocalculus alkaliphilus]|uniref:BREX protein BrxB domain-containing protein n=1 Tax=Methanocalculus alkaliphilus TaxID=768730 RepID=UPI00209C8F23|nr:BREX protein BrxB domain-containing protein [Methanocalculus alkaliphilus]MCP1715430.1 hypothetical protein [Methanocalculus alkaliphilus]